MAWTGTGDDRRIIGDAGEAEGERPDSNPGKEVQLSESRKLVWPDVSNVSLIDDPISYVPSHDQVAQPLSGVWVYLVVERGHTHIPRRSRSLLSHLGGLIGLCVILP